MPTATTALLDALAGGAVRVVDLTQPLSERTPVIQLPPPFANTPPLARRALSRYDDAGPAWAWDVLELGEHTGTHIDAPIHWITGRDGDDVGSIPVEHLVGPAVVIDRTARSRPGPTPRPPAGWPRSARSSASGWRPSASTRARPAASTRRFRSTTTCSVTAATG